jgi:hypothetical protein
MISPVERTTIDEFLAAARRGLGRLTPSAALDAL